MAGPLTGGASIEGKAQRQPCVASLSFSFSNALCTAYSESTHLVFLTRILDGALV